MTARAARVLVVGLGGLGCPCALALARAGVGTLRLCDDDVVDETNLARQILFDESSVGKSKLDEAERALAREAPATKIEKTPTRFLPARAKELLGGCDVVVEGADNFATKFLVADACAIARVPVVHAAGVKWRGTALAVSAEGRPCYRCVFEDLPGARWPRAPNCVDDGVFGPMLGVVGALQADLALALLDGRDVGGTFVAYDARVSRIEDALRRKRLHARKGCELCDARSIDDLDERRYKG